MSDGVNSEFSDEAELSDQMGLNLEEVFKKVPFWFQLLLAIGVISIFI